MTTTMHKLLNRETEVVAMVFFGLGSLGSQVRFQRPHLINPRIRTALDELTEAEFVTRSDDQRGPIVWTATQKMVDQVRSFRRPTAAELNLGKLIIEPPATNGSDQMRLGRRK